MRAVLAASLVVSLWLGAPAAEAEDVAASPPRALSVTIYRAPNSDAEGIVRQMRGYSGFALITETRDVTIPAGLNRLRFEGVADGIEAETALIAGLPGGIIEKNRDARQLNPSSLLRGSVGKQVTLQRTNRKTGQVTLSRATIKSAQGDQVVFETVDGVEILNCSGLPEAFTFEAADASLSARPTLSVLTRSGKAVKAAVTLSYLAQNFDWAADYVATLAPDGRTLDLGAWITLANGNGIGFPDSRTQIVAGAVGHRPSRDPADDATGLGGQERVLAECMPIGMAVSLAVPAAPPEIIINSPPPPMAPMMPIETKIIEQVKPPEPEQLGDLKLYRIPQPTTIASLQVKQVRLLDRAAVPVAPIYAATLAAEQYAPFRPARLLLRTKNDKAHHLDLPLPAGRVAAYQKIGERTLLFGRTELADKAVDEEVELQFGEVPDVQVSQVSQWGSTRWEHVNAVEIDNARRETIAFELEILLEDGETITSADHARRMKNGHPLFALNLAAGDKVWIVYRTEHSH
jgi:hypothetical protein